MTTALKVTFISAACLLALQVMAASVVTTRHNLSVSGPGPVKASQESQVCIFCHTPHQSSPVAALWNRSSPGQSYVPYSSSTAVAQPGQPTGSSLLCLSCHDGTIALGDVLSRSSPIVMAGGIITIPDQGGLIGTDLTHDHPISFVYNSGLATQQGELADPATLRPELSLDQSGQLQCTTCHDPHDDTNGFFLNWPERGGQLCSECHKPTGWTASPHSNSPSGWNGQAPDPWPNRPWSTVTDNACGNCHKPHSATGGPRLLFYAAEEQNCSACHNGNVATEDVMADFAKTSIHPITNTTLIHDPVEAGVINQRHVECQDCHNPHAARQSPDPVLGVLANVRGITISGGEIASITHSYEVCFRCHADNTNLPAPRTPRQHQQVNTREEFQLSNPSYHPVAGAGRNPDVPSLISPLTTSSVIECTDCHNSNSAASVGGNGPEGPHGSVFEPILARNYQTLDNTSESASNYALCYSCHSRSSILNDQSFGEHNKHINGERTPCNVCHDPHGVSAAQGTLTNNTHLINFDTSVVTPNNNGQLRFIDNGRYRGACDLRCHGKDHNNLSY